MPRNNPKSVLLQLVRDNGHTIGIPSGDGTKGLHSKNAHTPPLVLADPVDVKSSAQVALSKTAHSLKLRWSADVPVPTSNLGRGLVKFSL